MSDGGRSPKSVIDFQRSASKPNFYRVTRLFATTLFLSAFLLFLFQPMVGKMLLPWLGGAAAVWTTCVLFFQAMLLAGYVYAHLLSGIPDTRKQVLIHGVVLLVPFAFLPIRFSGTSSQGGLLVQLLLAAGVPFFAVSATAPLLQSWYARARGISSDPYFLYAASNAGSLLALIAYPLIIEPALGVSLQNRLWLALYAVFVPLLIVTAGFAWKDMASGGQQVRHPPKANSKKSTVLDDRCIRSFRFDAGGHESHCRRPRIRSVPVDDSSGDLSADFHSRLCPTLARLVCTRFSGDTVVLLAMFPLVASGVAAPVGLNWVVIGGHLILLYCGALLCHTSLAEQRAGRSAPDGILFLDCPGRSAGWGIHGNACSSGLRHRVRISAARRHPSPVSCGQTP